MGTSTVTRHKSKRANGVIHCLFDDGWTCDEKLGPRNLALCEHELKHGQLRAFFVEGHPAYLNGYPFEIGDDQYPMSVPAEEQIRFVMSVVSNHSERAQIAAICAPQARHIARAVLNEYNQRMEASNAPIP